MPSQIFWALQPMSLYAASPNETCVDKGHVFQDYTGGRFMSPLSLAWLH